MDGMRYVDILTEAWNRHLAPRTADALTVISLFAGCGGSSLGWSMAGFRELLAVDFDERCATTFRLNFPDVPFLVADLMELDMDDLVAAAGDELDGLDVLDGSPPCQGFSTANRTRAVANVRNQLYDEFARLLGKLRPRAFVMENVYGMARGQMKPVFTDCMRKLKTAGYRVTCRLVNAAYLGVPQRRERLIFVGMRNDLRIDPAHPLPERNPISVGKALEGVEADICLRLDKPTTPLGFLAWQSTKPGKSIPNYGTVKNLDPTCPAMTVRAAGASYHWSEVREMSLREQQVLQSFPLEFRFAGNRATVQKQIGNAVPPLMMERIASRAKASLAEADGRPDESYASREVTHDV